MFVTTGRVDAAQFGDVVFTVCQTESDINITAPLHQCWCTCVSAHARNVCMCIEPVWFLLVRFRTRTKLINKWRNTGILL